MTAKKDARTISQKLSDRLDKVAEELDSIYADGNEVVNDHRLGNEGHVDFNEKAAVEGHVQRAREARRSLRR